MATRPNRTLAEEWLPSRFNLAVFRLLGLIVALRVRHRPSRSAVLHHDREQHPLEAYALSCLLLAVPSMHVLGAAAPLLRLPWLTLPLLAIALPFAVTLAWDILIFGVALVALCLAKASGKSVPAISMQSPVIHSLMIALSIASIALGWRTAWLGYGWLALVALNAVCAIVFAVAGARIDGFAREVTLER